MRKQRLGTLSALVLCLILLMVTACGRIADAISDAIYGAVIMPLHTTEVTPAPTLTPDAASAPTPNPAPAPEPPPSEQIFTQDIIYESFYQASYREGVKAFENPPEYRYEWQEDGIIIIHVSDETNGIRQLAQGDIFVFEATEANPGGLSGHVIDVSIIDGYALIQARPPQSLDEVFYEFEISAEADLLALGGQIVINEEFAGMPGLSVGRNPNNLFFIGFDEFNLPEITISGRVDLIRPVVNHDIHYSRGRLDIRLLEMTAGASMDIEASLRTTFDEFLEIASINVWIKGVLISIPFGVRVTATGELNVQFDSKMEVHFGIINNNPFFSRTVDYNFSYDFNARIEFCADIRLQLSVLKYIQVYAVFANLGVGLETGTRILARCPEEKCFVIGGNIILRMGSVRGYGLTLLLPVLNFGPIYFLPSEPTHFYYYYNGRWHSACPHRMAEADVFMPLLGEWEGIYTGTEGGARGQVGTVGPRGINLLIYHDGFNHRVLANVTPVDGGLDGRFSYYGNLTIDEETLEFQMQGHSVIYNPEGRDWGFIRFNGHIDLENKTLHGRNYSDTGGTTGYQYTGPFTIYQLSGFAEGDDITGGPAPGFVIIPREHHVTYVTVSPSSRTMPRGNSVTFDATVMGLGMLSQEIIWTVEGANHADTEMKDNVLFIASDETAETLTVRVSSAQAPNLNSTAIVTIGTWEITATPAHPDFGTHNPGYSNRPLQTIAITNTGDQPITLEPLPDVDNWTLSPNQARTWGNPINPGQTRTFTLRPVRGLPSGTYNPGIIITADNLITTTVIYPTFTVR
ncbi:MAG: hypothetical protein FWD90_09775 [Defluviitaleaceae bacterium]|nr:hypothetical protein [Defluviitaleaceae bacterium]